MAMLFEVFAGELIINLDKVESVSYDDDAGLYAYSDSIDDGVLLHIDAGEMAASVYGSLSALCVNHQAAHEASHA